MKAGNGRRKPGIMAEKKGEDREVFTPTFLISL